jgi:hypothetical protein
VVQPAAKVVELAKQTSQTGQDWEELLAQIYKFPKLDEEEAKVRKNSLLFYFSPLRIEEE